MSNRHGHPLTSEQKGAREIEYRKMALEFHKETGRSPRMADLPFPYKIFKVHDTWNAFLEDCGLEVNRLTTDVEKYSLIFDYKELAKNLERTPYALEFYKKFGCQYAVRKLFGSWNAFVKACDLKLNRFTGAEKEELVERVLKLAKKLGKTPTTREFNAHAKKSNLCTTMVICRYFGTWTECLEFCGLEPNQNKNFKRRKKD
ncbi:hypothetical protein SBF1_50030 [Candidatus Desulfosporosinus infrequens]|uniref:Uncharacterized protein n=1 Tax=Candidatus Desulfosporosinus infrequens TaxID=2043169 RepID=A0A2U3LH61_9FIRM|nr:hypothetical protein SBF1_50030 [Candidatus Desulfosporosinus infrequens]